MQRILISLAFAVSIPAFAAPTLRDVGVIGLLSHDIFAWDHKTEQDTENGRVDLSTIFDYDGGSRWEKGGNPKNSENAPVYTVTMELVNFYKARVAEGLSETDARKATVRYFHETIKQSYLRTRGQPFPAAGIDAATTTTEQAALRAMHDLLPGRVKLYDRVFRHELVLTNFLTAKTILNQKELDQPLKPFDGDYDEEYRDIHIPFSGGVTLDLKKIDGEFIEKFSPYKQADMLAALAQVGRGEITMDEVFFVHHLDDLSKKPFVPTVTSGCRKKYPANSEQKSAAPAALT